MIEQAVNGSQSEAPTKIVIAISSDEGDTGTMFFQGAVLTLTERLRHKISKAYEFVRDDDDIAEVEVYCDVRCIAGSDHMDYADLNLSEDEEARIDALIESLSSEGGRVATDDDLATALRAQGNGDGKSCVIVTKYCSPSLMVREKYGHERFSSCGIELLEPPEQIAFREQLSLRHAERDRQASIDVSELERQAHV